GFILPGDRVDVVMLRTETQQGGETENSADVLLENVKVLAIDQLVNEKQDQPAVATVAKAVTLPVSPQQAQKVLLAGNVGKLSLILRQAGEARLAQSGRVTDGDLGFAKREQKATPRPISVATADKGPLPSITQALRSTTTKVTIFHGTDEKKYDVVHE